MENKLREDKIKKICNLLDKISNEISIDYLNKINIEDQVIYTKAKRILSVTNNIDFIIMNQKMNQISYTLLQDNKKNELSYYTLESVSDNIHCINIVNYMNNSKLKITLYINENGILILKNAIKQFDRDGDLYYISCKIRKNIKIDHFTAFKEYNIEKIDISYYKIHLKNISKKETIELTRIQQQKYLNMFIKNIGLVQKIRKSSELLNEAIKTYTKGKKTRTKKWG